MRKFITGLFVAVLCAAFLPVSAGAAANKVEMCHEKGNGDFQLLRISSSASSAHLGHGDGIPGGPVPDMAGYEFGQDCAVVEVAAGPVSMLFTGDCAGTIVNDQYFTATFDPDPATSASSFEAVSSNTAPAPAAGDGVNVSLARSDSAGMRTFLVREAGHDDAIFYVGQPCDSPGDTTNVQTLSRPSGAQVVYDVRVISDGVAVSIEVTPTSVSP